ncbi:hypothetical protein BY996DRAFT_6946662 [Phakopsora pachyrhizi]|nr:hypothetical protein BY996DRAFT_6946662 [Phakopsora pachyrhizi]
MERSHLKKLKVQELKELLKTENLPVTGKKDELIQRLIDRQDEQRDEEQVEGDENEDTVDQVTIQTKPSDQPDKDKSIVTLPPTSQPPPSSSTASAGEQSSSTSKPPLPDESLPSSKLPLPPQTPPPQPEVESEQPQIPPPPAEEESELPPPPPPLEQEIEPPSKRFKTSNGLSNGSGHQTQDFRDQSVKLEVEDDDYEDEEDVEMIQQQEAQTKTSGSDLYLDTVNRDMLDFDFERLCSVTLSNINIYACLVCGKYFQGRSKTSPAYAHSIGEDHHVYINLVTEKVYVLPDGYEVSDPSLEDIKYLLNPTFTPDLLKKLDSGVQGPSYDLHTVSYLPGFVGLNNIKANDYMNVIIHLLAHVPPIRDYFICRSSDQTFERERATELIQRFGTLMRKIWNPRAFKAQVSPHEFGQEVATRSNRRFTLTEQADPIEFLGWLLNTLHRDLGGSKNSKKVEFKDTSIIHETFRGIVQTEEEEIVAVPDSGQVGQRPKFDIDQNKKQVKSSNFLLLTLDLPPPPIFQDSVQKNIIPQVNLINLLMKYNGSQTIEKSGRLKRFVCKKLPRFIILHFKRFDVNNFIEEKNPTIVNFSTRGVNFGDCLGKSLEQHQQGEIEREEELYDLLGNITYSSTAGTAKDDSQWKVQVHTRPISYQNEDEKWFQIQDLIVEEVNRQMVFLGETYVQIWEKRKK